MSMKSLGNKMAIINKKNEKSFEDFAREILEQGKGSDVPLLVEQCQICKLQYDKIILDPTSSDVEQLLGG